MRTKIATRNRPSAAVLAMRFGGITRPTFRAIKDEGFGSRIDIICSSSSARNIHHDTCAGRSITQPRDPTPFFENLHGTRQMCTRAALLQIGVVLLQRLDRAPAVAEGGDALHGRGRGAHGRDVRNLVLNRRLTKVRVIVLA